MEIAWGLFIKSKSLIYLTSLFLLTLNFKSGEGQLQILNESADYDGRASNFNCIRCLVAGSGDKIFQWYHNGNLITSRYNLSFLSFNNDTLVVDKRSVNLRYEGTYQMFVSSPFGRIFCAKIKVKFKVAGSFIGDHSLPDIRPVVDGRPYFLKCPKHSHTRGCHYKWGGHSHSMGVTHMKDYEHRVVLPDGTLFFSAINNSDIIDFGKEDGGHGCIIDCSFNGFHSMTRSHKIRFDKAGVNASRFGPTIVTAIKDKVVALGTRFVKATCAAAGSPTPSYHWVRIDDENNEVDIKNIRDITELGEFNHTLAIFDIDRHHNGTYACVATIGTKRDMVRWKLIVRVAPEWLPDFKIADKFVDVFTNLTWECKATGDPLPTYTWYSNASQMDTRSERHKIDGGKISFSRVHVEDMRMYQCVAENDFGFIYQTVALHVRARKPEFNITSTIVVFLNNSEATLACQADAIPRATYSWSRNGLKVLPSTKYEYVDDGELLVIKNVTNEDGGVYTCTAENAFGKDEKVINVTSEHITFLKKPQSNYNITKGSSFSLQCEVKSSQEFYYKWKFNDRDLQYDDAHIWNESENKLHIKNANESHSGRYECVAYIIKPAPAKNSAAATIFITGPPDALRGLHLKQQCNNFTAILGWGNQVGYNPINETSVIIEWQSTYDPPDRWYRLSERMNAIFGQAKVEKLSPGTKFRFRAITQNKYGDGPPSEPTKYESCETSPTRPDKCPKILHVEREGSGVMTIKWKALKEIDFNGPGFNYVVKYKHRNELTWNHTVVKKSENKFTLPNARTSQSLIFMLQANNSKGLGPSCLENNVSNAQSKPGLITQVKIKEIGSSSVLITWQLENSDIANINGFKLEYGEVGTITNRKKRSENRYNCTDISTKPCSTAIIPMLEQSTNEHRISGLTATTQYNISIRAFNSIGNGPPTYFTFKTVSPGFDERIGSPVYKQDWFITVISMIVLLMFITAFIVFVLNIKRSNRYRVGKRERMLGGFHDLHDLYDPEPEPIISPSKARATSLKSSIHISDGSTIAGVDEVSLAMSTEDKYDDDESFVGEYSDKSSTKKFEEMFV